MDLQSLVDKPKPSAGDTIKARQKEDAALNKKASEVVQKPVPTQAPVKEPSKTPPPATKATPPATKSPDPSTASPVVAAKDKLVADKNLPSAPLLTNISSQSNGAVNAASANNDQIVKAASIAQEQEMERKQILEEKQRKAQAALDQGVAQAGVSAVTGSENAIKWNQAKSGVLQNPPGGSAVVPPAQPQSGVLMTTPDVHNPQDVVPTQEHIAQASAPVPQVATNDDYRPRVDAQKAAIDSYSASIERDPVKAKESAAKIGKTILDADKKGFDIGGLLRDIFQGIAKAKYAYAGVDYQTMLEKEFATKQQTQLEQAKAAAAVQEAEGKVAPQKEIIEAEQAKSLAEITAQAQQSVEVARQTLPLQLANSKELITAQQNADITKVKELLQTEIARITAEYRAKGATEIEIGKAIQPIQGYWNAVSAAVGSGLQSVAPAAASQAGVTPKMPNAKNASAISGLTQKAPPAGGQGATPTAGQADIPANYAMQNTEDANEVLK